MGRIRCLVVLAGIVVCFTSNAFAQINTGWIDGKKRQKRTVDNDSKPLQLALDISVGTSTIKWNSTLPDTSQYWWGHDWEEEDILYDVAVGFNYRLLRNGEKGSTQVEISIFGSAGIYLSEFDGDDIRILVTAGPELGIRLPASESFIVRPFLSIGPGLSILNQWWSDENVNLVWVPRGGVELQFGNNPFSLVIGGKMILHGTTTEDAFSARGYEISEDALLGTLGFRIKI